MKKKWIAVLIVFIMLGIGISGFLIWTDNGDELDSYNMDAHPGLEWEQVKNQGYNKRNENINGILAACQKSLEDISHKFGMKEYRNKSD